MYKLSIPSTAKWPELERIMEAWVMERRDQGLPISDSDVRKITLRKFGTCGGAVLPDAERGRYRHRRRVRHRFRASNGWNNLFMRRLLKSLVDDGRMQNFLTRFSSSLHSSQSSTLASASYNWHDMLADENIC